MAKEVGEGPAAQGQTGGGDLAADAPQMKFDQNGPDWFVSPSATSRQLTSQVALQTSWVWTSLVVRRSDSWWHALGK